MAVFSKKLHYVHYKFIYSNITQGDKLWPTRGGELYTHENMSLPLYLHKYSVGCHIDISLFTALHCTLVSHTESNNVNTCHGLGAFSLMLLINYTFDANVCLSMITCEEEGR